VRAHRLGETKFNNVKLLIGKGNGISDKLNAERVDWHYWPQNLVEPSVT